MTYTSTMPPRTQLIRTCRALHDEGLIAGSSGNASMRVEDELVLATPAGGAKGELHEDALLRLDVQGRAVDHTRSVASSEIQVHLHIYRGCPHVGAVVHAHPVVATALAQIKGLNLCVTAEGAVNVGPLAQLDYVRPGTEALATLCARAVQDGAVTLLLAMHGAVCVGATLDEARFRMNSLEHVAKVWMAQHGIDALTWLEEAEVQALRAQAGLDASWPSAARRYGAS